MMFNLLTLISVVAELFAVIGGVLGLVVFIKSRKESRKSFLVGIICDHNIPLESRKPFYDEYISLGGNGTVQQAWLSFQGGE